MLTLASVLMNELSILDVPEISELDRFPNTLESTSPVVVLVTVASFATMLFLKSELVIVVLLAAPKLFLAITPLFITTFASVCTVFASKFPRTIVVLLD